MTSGPMALALQGKPANQGNGCDSQAPGRDTPVAGFIPYPTPNFHDASGQASSARGGNMLVTSLNAKEWRGGRATLLAAIRRDFRRRKFHPARNLDGIILTWNEGA